ncbi:hypothetical protein Tco_0880466 [Tanacetum coccineum]
MQMRYGWWIRLRELYEACSAHGIWPSRKRCRSHTASVPLPTYDSRSIAPTHADLLPPCKRFKDSYSPKDSGEEHIEVDTTDAKAVADVGISDGVVAHTKDSIGMRVEIAASDVREDDEEFKAEAIAADIREIISLHGQRCIDRDTKIEDYSKTVGAVGGFPSSCRDRDEYQRRLLFRRLESYVERTVWVFAP